jgi:phosphatidylinositol-3-phosphatase
VNGTGAIDHVVVIVEENKPAGSILGGSSAPYLNKLAGESALAANYAGITHPSLPNYLALTSGTTAGITGDCSPKDAGCTANVRNITDAVTQSGRSWKSYAEGMPAPCQTKNSGRYAVRHNPFMYYPGVTADQGSCAAHVVPFTALEEDLKSSSSLPDFVLIIPDLCNDMHDCPVKTGDDWLSRQVPKILASPAFTTQNSLLVITWDEGDDSTNQSVTIFAGPAARTAVRSDAPYNHYSLLHTIENVWGLPPLTENDRSAPVMGDLLK